LPKTSKQWVQARGRADGLGCGGEARGVDENAGFHAKGGGGGFQRGFEDGGVERVGLAKASRGFFEARLFSGPRL